MLLVVLCRCYKVFVLLPSASVCYGNCNSVVIAHDALWIWAMEHARRFPTDPKEYKLCEEVGDGVSATVYKALCIPLNIEVAIKVLDLEKCSNDLVSVLSFVHFLCQISFCIALPCWSISPNKIISFFYKSNFLLVLYTFLILSNTNFEYLFVLSILRCSLWTWVHFFLANRFLLYCPITALYSWHAWHSIMHETRRETLMPTKINRCSSFPRMSISTEGSVCSCRIFMTYWHDSIIWAEHTLYLLGAIVVLF